MCLDKVEDFIPEKYAKRGFAYKIFSVGDGEIRNAFCGRLPGLNYIYDLDAWYKNPEPDIEIEISNTSGLAHYKSGFHLFVEYIHAVRFMNLPINWWANVKTWQIMRIEYDSVHTYGKQEGIPCLVANEMKILGPA